MILIAVRPGQKLYDEDGLFVVVDDDDGERYEMPGIALDSILARGYWESPVQKHGGSSHNQKDHGNWARGVSQLDQGSPLYGAFEDWKGDPDSVSEPDMNLIISAFDEHAQEINETLYRAGYMRNDWVVGSTTDFDLVNASSDIDVAREFGGRGATLFVFEGGVRGIPIDRMMVERAKEVNPDYFEDEILIRGKFVITRIDDGSVGLRQSD